MQGANRRGTMQLLSAVARHYETHRRARLLMIPLIFLSATSIGLVLGTGASASTSRAVSDTISCGPVDGSSHVDGVVRDTVSDECAPCNPDLTAYLLTATTQTGGNFDGIFCVDANGDGTYTQLSVPDLDVTLTGTGHVRVEPHGVFVIEASGPIPRSFSLVGTTNGTSSSFGEMQSGLPDLTGTFTLVAEVP